MSTGGRPRELAPAPELLYLLEIGRGVSTIVAPEDEMFTGSREHYFLVGRSAFDAICLALKAAGKNDVRRILDLPCGHGRVLRYLRAAFPDAELTACDLNRSGVGFCAETFDALPVHSAERTQAIGVQGGFDLIWCGSLVTHFEAGRFREFLGFFVSLLAPGGVLVLTTHGRGALVRIERGDSYALDASGVRRLLRGYRRHGFGYAPYPGMDAYGVSLSAPSWVCAQIEQLPDVRIALYAERAWDDHQDVVGCVRTI